MTAKKKPRTGATGLLRIPCMVMMEVGGNFPSPQFYDRAVNIERQPGAGGLSHTPRRRDDGWAVPACRGPEIRAGLRFDHVWIGFMAPAAGCWPHAQ